MVLQPWFMLGKPSTTGLHPQPSTTSAPLLFQYCRPQGSIQAPPPYLLSQGLPLAWTCVVRLETHLLLPSLGWDLKHTAPCPGFYTSSWTQTWVLVLWRQSLYQQSHPGILSLFGCWCLVSCFVFWTQASTNELTNDSSSLGIISTAAMFLQCPPPPPPQHILLPSTLHQHLALMQAWNACDGKPLSLCP